MSENADGDTNATNNADIIKMIIALQEKSSHKRNTININPMTAFISAAGIILILIQFVIGFGMWSIQDRLKRYDAYEKRLGTLEKSIVRFETIPESIDKLVTEIRMLTKNNSTDKSDILKRIRQLEVDFIVLKRDLK